MADVVLGADLGTSGLKLAALDLDGAVTAETALGPALLWPDQRASAELDAWRGLPPAERAALANPLVPGMTGPLTAWLARHEPDRVARAAAVLLPKDAVRAALVPGAD